MTRGILLLSFITPISASEAKPPVDIKLEKTYTSVKAPEGERLTALKVGKLSEAGASFRFAGTECVIDSTKGCRVVRSNNSMFPRGYIFSAVTKQVSKSAIVSSSFSRSCNWCSFVGDAMAIVLFVYYAPISAPTVILVATYTVGIGIILGNAQDIDVISLLLFFALLYMRLNLNSSPALKDGNQTVRLRKRTNIGLVLLGLISILNIFFNIWLDRGMWNGDFFSPFFNGFNK